MRDELKDRKSDKEIIKEKDGKKKVVEVNQGSFSERDHHRKNEGPAFTADSPTTRERK
ncbi:MULTISPECIES: hypothetical protein [Olivibacter]|jgi:hypothetical protein|uniref:Uncharacterized protein n=3 Tax=Sphingobacteriaceae TaxID=84566 RepID=F4C611_SPHS2|nr:MULTISPECIES: hypothetical protein [Olivibacter]MDM8175728.1 hypothetical protein [Olivibacter sp. 47]MDX3914335.1 hypothetical protein [Pseudosphingobacterium sp.]